MHLRAARDVSFRRIANWRAYSAEPGRARVRFRPSSNRSVELLGWERLPEPEPERRAGTQPPAEIGEGSLVFLRLSAPDDASQCFSVAAVKRYLHHVDLALRLMTGGLYGLNETGSFISPECVLVSSDCYQRNTSCLLGEVREAFLAKYSAELKGRTFSTWFYMAHTASTASDGVGVALLGDFALWTIRSEYWAISRVWHSFPDDVLLNNLGTILRLVHRNAGFGKASRAADSVGFINDFLSKNDGWNMMSIAGSGTRWWQIPDPAHYTMVVNRGAYVAHWFRFMEDGEHLYRLLAWDHPLSRVLLGPRDPAFDDADLIGGLEFRYNVLALFFRYTSEDFNSAIPSNVTKAAVAMYYRGFPSERASFEDRSVVLSLGRTTRGGELVPERKAAILLNAMNDGLDSWSASTLPLGYVSMPEQDIGTLSFEAKRFHQPESRTPNPAQVESPPASVSLEEVPYVEMLVRHYPGVPFSKPTTPSAPPEFEFSSSLVNCKRTGPYAVECERVAPFSVSVWWFFVKGGAGSCREGNLPRITSQKREPLSGSRVAYTSYRYSTNILSFVYCGRKDREEVRETEVYLKPLEYGVIDKIDYSMCLVSRKLSSASDRTYVAYPLGSDPAKHWDAVTVRDLRIPADGEVFVSDLYGNRRAMEIYEIGGIALLEPYATQAYSDNVVIVRNATHVVGGEYFYRYRTAPTKRLSVRSFNESTMQFEIVPADDPVMNSAPTIIERSSFIGSEWYFFVHTRWTLDDYISFDFGGVVPENLTLSLETDAGVYSKSLWFLGGLSDISYRVSSYDIHLALGGWSEILRFQFSDDVVLESIRMAMWIQFGQFPFPRPRGVYWTYLGEYTFRLNCSGSDARYSFAPFTASFLGRSLTFMNATDSFIVDYQPTTTTTTTTSAPPVECPVDSDWPPSAAPSTAYRRCRGTAKGVMWRECAANGQWKAESNATCCSSFPDAPPGRFVSSFFLVATGGQLALSEWEYTALTLELSSRLSVSAGRVFLFDGLVSSVRADSPMPSFIVSDSAAEKSSMVRSLSTLYSVTVGGDVYVVVVPGGSSKRILVACLAIGGASLVTVVAVIVFLVLRCRTLASRSKAEQESHAGPSKQLLGEVPFGLQTERLVPPNHRLP